MLGAVVLFMLSAWLILDNAWLALAVSLPLVLSEHVAVGVVAYLGTDAILAFFLALTLFAWVALAMSGKAAGPAGVILVVAAAAPSPRRRRPTARLP